MELSGPGNAGLPQRLGYVGLGVYGYGCSIASISIYDQGDVLPAAVSRAASSRRPLSVPKAGPIARRPTGYYNLGAGQTVATVRYGQRAVGPLVNPRPYYQSLSSSNSVPPNGCSIRAWIEYPVGSASNLGTIYPVTFGGRLTTTLDPGGDVIADPVGLMIPAGDPYATLTQATVPTAAGALPNSALTGYGYQFAASDGYVEGDYVPTTGGATPSTGDNAYRFGPVQVFGDTPGPPLPLVLWLDDSIGAGQGADNTAGSYATQGVNATGKFSCLLQAMPGELASNVAHAATGAAGYLRYAYLATHAVVKLVTNDLSSGHDLYTIQTDILTLGNFLAAQGIKVLLCTVPPCWGSSTDGFVTIAHQTVGAYQATRASYNAWALTVPAPFAGCVDVAAAVEDPSNPGKFLAVNGAATTVDGTHPNILGHHLMAAAVTTAANAFTVPDGGSVGQDQAYKIVLGQTVGGVAGTYNPTPLILVPQPTPPGGN